jgi:hypothetical protein
VLEFCDEELGKGRGRGKRTYGLSCCLLEGKRLKIGWWQMLGVVGGID